MGIGTLYFSFFRRGEGGGILVVERRWGVSGGGGMGRWKVERVRDVGYGWVWGGGLQTRILRRRGYSAQRRTEEANAIS